MSYFKNTRQEYNDIRVGTIVQSKISGKTNSLLVVAIDGEIAVLLCKDKLKELSFNIKVRHLKNDEMFKVIGKLNLFELMDEAVEKYKLTNVKSKKLFVRLELKEDCEDGPKGKPFVLHIYHLNEESTLEEIENYIETIYKFDMSRWEIKETKMA